jgi:hypothetical protein
MENNDKQLIDQALSFVNENNRFAMKTITKNSVSRSNFYKLSVELSEETLKDVEDSKTHVEPSTKPYTPVIDFKGLVDDENPEGKSKDESEEKSEDKSKDEPKDKSKEKRKGLFERMLLRIKNDQAHGIYRFLRDIKSDKLNSLSLEDIINMSPQERANLLEVEYRPGARNLPGKILNTDIGRR